MKKLLAFLLVAIMLLSVMSCGPMVESENNEENKGGDSSGDTTGDADNSSDIEDEEITEGPLVDWEID